MSRPTPEPTLKLLNLTPLPVVIYGSDGTTILHTFPPSGFELCRLAKPEQQLDPVCVSGANGSVSIPCVLVPDSTWMQYKPGFPDFPIVGNYDGVIVSKLVGDSIQRKTNFLPVTAYGPDTGPTSVVLAADGTVLGSKRLVQYSCRRRRGDILRECEDEILRQF